jgi:hypothetical protein
MQVFIKRSDLTGAADEHANIMASYDDSVAVDPTWHGSDKTVMSVPPVVINYAGGLPSLFPDWRNNVGTQVLTGEANLRITAVFPDYSQRNANAEINGYITSYGADTTVWPAAAQSRKAEIDRCWSYVNEVRAKANAMSEISLPLDPTADGNWPTRVPPYVPS